MLDGLQYLRVDRVALALKCGDEGTDDLHVAPDGHLGHVLEQHRRRKDTEHDVEPRFPEVPSSVVSVACSCLDEAADLGTPCPGKRLAWRTTSYQRHIACDKQ